MFRVYGYGSEGNSRRDNQKYSEQSELTTLKGVTLTG